MANRHGAHRLPIANVIKTMTITRISALDVIDVRFPTSRQLDGSDAMNPEPDYSAAYVALRLDDSDVAGYSLLFTTGRGNDVACAAVRALGGYIVGRDVAELVADVSALARELIWDGQLRWLGPEKGVMHMAIGAVINAAWDLRCRLDGQPLWRLLASLSPQEIIRQIDFTYIDDALTASEALDILEAKAEGRGERIAVLEAEGLPAYTTSAGWLGYDDDKVARLARRSVSDGFTMLKLKVGADVRSDVRRLGIARHAVGERARIALDANQRWGVRQAIDWMAELAEFDPYWIEEPTSPDDVLGHLAIRRAVRPIRVATGEHVQNRVIFKQLLQARGDRCRPDRCLPGGRCQREPRHPRARRQVRRARLPPRRWRGSVRDGSAPRDVRLHRGERHDGRAMDRVRRPPPRALHRSRRRERRTVPRSCRAWRGCPPPRCIRRRVPLSRGPSLAATDVGR